MEIEYYAYDSLGDYMVFRKFDSAFWESIAIGLQNARKEFLKTKKLIHSPALISSMYIDKTEKYYHDLINNFDKFRAIAKKETLIINGEKYWNFEKIWDSVKKLIKDELLLVDNFSVIHGDFCFSNILCGVNQKTGTTILKFIDPRGNFGVDGVFGDPLYDSAKLLHSYEGGYEYIIYDQFKVEEDLIHNSYHIKFANDNKDKISEIFAKITDFRSLKSKVIEGLIYLGMCSRHYDSINRQTAMYLNGIRILNEVLRKKI